MEQWYKDGEVFNSFTAIRNKMKEVSLPMLLNENFVAELGFIKVVEGVKPTPSEVQYVVEGTIGLVAGVPTRSYTLRDMFADTPSYTDSMGVVISAMTKLEHETAYLAKKQAESVEQLKQHFKDMYLAYVNAKLKALDYDSLATVKLWEGDATFGAEATRILTWYKAIIAMNYALLNDVGIGTVPIPTDTAYQAMLDGVVF